MLWIILAGVAAYFIYIAIIKPMGYWKETNVPFSTPWPVLGSFAPLVFRKKNFLELIQLLYNEFPDRRYFGIFTFLKPQLLVRDPELIKRITIKDFDYFMDRTSTISEVTDPLLSKNLVSLTGQRWRDMRATLSPSFTASKMRFMFNLISDCAEQFTKYFEQQGSGIIDVEMKEISSRFTNDAIATAAFGVTVDSLNEKENEFFVMGKNSTNFGGFRALKFFGHSIIPGVMKFFKISIFPTNFADFFTRIVKETIEVREKNGVVRPDMIHLLLEARRGRLSNDDERKVTDEGFAVVEHSPTEKIDQIQKETLTEEDITAQAMIFFFAGFETTSTLLSFMGHELAVNTDVQEKLHNEIDETLEQCSGKITYEAVMGMKYLDMVVSESLRMWPPAVALERICVKDYLIQPELPNEEPLLIKKGLSINIPVVAIHHDPKYFPNPEKFDPERFSDENKSNIVPLTYMPFGAGPRSCIASRFALMETKILFFHLLSKFEIVPIEKTTIPLVLSRKKLIMTPDGGFWLGLRLRKSKIEK